MFLFLWLPAPRETFIKLYRATWPATKDELIDYAVRSGAPLEVIENLQEIEDEGDVYESIEEIGPTTQAKRTSSLTTKNGKAS